MKVLLIGLVSVITVLMSSCESGSDLVDYMPVIRVVQKGDHLLVDEPKLLDKEHHKVFTKILDKYNEKYEVVGNFVKIRISNKLAMDRDLLANYTKKAEQLRKTKKIVP